MSPAGTSDEVRLRRYGHAVTRFRVVPAAYVLLRRGDEVLLQLRSNTGYMDDHWAMSAAGHVEHGESVHEAAVREIREELGLVISGDDLVPACVMHRTQPGGDPIDERVDFFFTLSTWQGTARVVEHHKAADLAWFPIGSLPPNVVPHERVVLDGLRDDDLPAVLTHGF